MQFYEIRLIIQGGIRRYHNMWSAVRWQTYNLMLTGMADLKKAGIYKATDLIQFPWDNEEDDAPLVTEEEHEYLQKLMADNPQI